MISNFPAKRSYNPGGYKGFKFSPLSAVSIYPAIQSGAINLPYTFTQGNGWLDGYATYGTLLFKEIGVPSDNGKFYNQEITGFVPGDSPELSALMDEMEQQPFIIRLLDPRGKMRVAGTHCYPLIFTAEFNSGGNRPDAKGYTFKFTGQSIFRAPAYNA